MMARTSARSQCVRHMIAAFALSCATRICSASLLRAQASHEPVSDSKGRCGRPVEQLQHALERYHHATEGAMLEQKAFDAASFWPFSFGHKQSSKKDKNDTTITTSSKVEIGLYYEALCPYCKNLMNKSVIQLWNDTEMQKRIDIKFYPYGNAMALQKDTVSDGYKFWHEELDSSGFDYVFACQHGQEECFGNTIQTCAMNVLGKPKKYVPFILCMETYKEGASLEMASFDCASRLSIDMLPIRECTRGKKGNKIMVQIGEATESLKPPHEYVPWVTLNGEHSEASEQDADDGEGNMMRQVCDRLSDPKPDLCK